jgi:hypothetical protein
LIGTATDELEPGRVGNVCKKCKNGKIELCFVVHKLRTAGNVGNKGKKGKIEFCFCHA